MSPKATANRNEKRGRSWKPERGWASLGITEPPPLPEQRCATETNWMLRAWGLGWIATPGEGRTSRCLGGNSRGMAMACCGRGRGREAHPGLPDGWEEKVLSGQGWAHAKEAPRVCRASVRARWAAAETAELKHLSPDSSVLPRPPSPRCDREHLDWKKNKNGWISTMSNYSCQSAEALAASVANL